MAEHWCKEHGSVWFKKGKMRGYAHPITDENGEPTGEWCNEPEEEKALKATSRSIDSPERQASIETQNAYTGVVMMMGSGIIKKEDPLGQAAINYASTKLSKWYSQGAEVEKTQEEPPKEELSTQDQRNKILAVAKERGYAVKKEKGYDYSLPISVMLRLFKVGSTKELTKKQASEFISIMEQGEYLANPDKIKPEDLPF